MIPALSPRVLAVSSLLYCACSAPPAPVARQAGHALPPLPDAVVVYDTAQSSYRTFDELLDALAMRDVVFLGETHLDDTTHRCEAAVYEGLIARRAGRVVLSLEMFETDVQPVLDDYLAGRIDEAAFLAKARPWGNYRDAYAPLIELARAHGLPVVAANFPAPLRQKVSRGGAEALAALTPEQRATVPQEILPGTDEYQARVDRAVRGHMGGGGSGDPEARRFNVQNLWDNSMGDACARALAAHPGHLVLHVVGGFHVAYGDGTARQLALRAPDARTAVVEITPAHDLYSPQPERDRARADYLVYALALARNQDSGTHAVVMPKELRYRLVVPKSAARGREVPLLVWLPDAGERPEDAAALWSAALGGAAAVAVVVPPYPELAEDLAPGGRFAQGETFRADQAQLQRGLERLVEYVSRRCPVRGDRIVVAGRGTGATAALWSAMYGELLRARFVAIEPAGAHKLREEGLPDVPPATLGVEIVGEVSEAMGMLADDYQSVGVSDARAVAGWPDPEVRAVRTALGLEEATPAPEANEPILLLVREGDSARAKQWADILARLLQSRGKPCEVVAASALEERLRVAAAPSTDASMVLPGGASVAVRPLRFGGPPLDLGGATNATALPPWQPQELMDGIGIPVPAGAFGGTTVLVVPGGTGAEENAAWLALETSGALQKRHRFSSLRVAFADGTPSLETVLGELRADGRTEVLVVPAVFCAKVAVMQQLRRSAGSLEGLEVTWLPGLGAEAAELVRAELAQ